MKVALTGTPGTGKTTISRLLPYRIVDINYLVNEGLSIGVDNEKGCLEADMDGIDDWLSDLDTADIVILDGHFSHFFAKKAIVLRLNPRDLRKRLESRGYNEKKIRENLEAEAIDIVLAEAVENCDQVDEIDTTGKTPEQVAGLIIRVIKGEIGFAPGQVDWLKDFLDSEWISE